MNVYFGGNMPASKTLILILISFISIQSQADEDDKLEFFSAVNSELVHQQCEESYKAAEKKFEKQNRPAQKLLEEAMDHQGVIDTIVGNTKDVVENAETPYGKFVQDYFSKERPSIGMANILVQKDQRIELANDSNIKANLKGAGFALGSESSRNRLSFRFRFQGNCVATKLKDCKTTPRESILNVRVLKDAQGDLKYQYELDKHAEPVKRDEKSALSQIGFYGNGSVIKGQVKNQSAVADFMNLEQKKFEQFMIKEVGKACFDYIADKNKAAPHEIRPHEFKPHEFKPHETRPHELGGAEELFTGLNRHLTSGALKRQPAALEVTIDENESSIEVK